MMTSNTSDLITKKDLHKMFWRSLPMEFSWHYERQMHMGFEFMMIPALRKIYDNDPEKFNDSLQRHLEFFNIHVFQYLYCRYHHFHGGNECKTGQL